MKVLWEDAFKVGFMELEEYKVEWKGACSREGGLETEWRHQSCHRNHVEVTAWAATGFH